MVFHNMVDVVAYNVLVLWREIHPDWMSGKLNKRRLFLEHLGKALSLLTRRNARRKARRRSSLRSRFPPQQATGNPSQEAEVPCLSQEQGRQDQDRLLCLPHSRVLEVRRHVLPLRPVSQQDPSDNDDERRGPLGSN